MIYLHKYVKVYQHRTSLQPLMRRFQAALKDYLTKQMEEVNLDLRELVCGILSLPSTAAHPCPRCQPISCCVCRGQPRSGAARRGKSWGWFCTARSSSWRSCRRTCTRATSAAPGRPRRASAWRRSWRPSGSPTGKRGRTQTVNARKVTEAVLAVFPNSSTTWRSELE